MPNPTPNIPQLPAGEACAVILAGGLGTRLRGVIPNLPKCMAPVAGHPFLYYVINQLRREGIQKIIFSLGYLHTVIEEWLEKEFPTLHYEISLEEEPLGTGGAIQLALQKTRAEHVFVVNGDSLFKCKLDVLIKSQIENNAECTLALKGMHHFDRYGVVEMDKYGMITSFREKQFYAEGLINTGLYLVNREQFLRRSLPVKFSFEKDYLEKFTADRMFSAVVQNGYFIDIGIPEDFERAQLEFELPPLDLSKIDTTWTLFLDRDGVINHQKDDSYILHADEFVFMDGGPQLFKTLSEKFKRIIVVTNQRGVGRGLMTEAALQGIHKKMLEAVETSGGNINKVYYVTNIDDRSFMRKPNPGMALLAMQDFPKIDMSKSIMVGNTLSDMQFGRNAGMHTVLVSGTQQNISLPNPYIDLHFPSLLEFARAL